MQTAIVTDFGRTWLFSGRIVDIYIYILEVEDKYKALKPVICMIH